MAAALKPGWSKPSNILFASDVPANEKAFGFALAQAAEFGLRALPGHHAVPHRSGRVQLQGGKDSSV